MRRLLIVSGVILSFFFLQSCEKKSVPPSLSATSVNAITTSSAVAGGSITNDGGATISSRGVCWNTSDDPTIGNSKKTAGDDLAFTSDITQLSPNTSYYARVYATNSAGTGYGKSVSFKTLGDKPVTAGISASNIAIRSASLNGSVNPNSLSTTISFEWGTTTSYGKTATPSLATVTGEAPVAISADLSELKPGTTYHFRLVATNVLGTSNSDDLSFKTLGAPPTVITEQAQNVKITEATLVGAVNPNLLPTDFFMEYGTTTSYGALIPASQYPFSGDEFIGTSGLHTGLTPETTYHYRVIAENELGRTIGADVQFTTYSLEDVDHNYYHSVSIGTQRWMKENLKTTHFADESVIPNVTDNTGWNNLTTSAYCWYNNDGTANKNTYGALYNWYAVNNGNLCPAGWHVPTSAEWTTLTAYLGGESGAATKLKESGNAHWGGTNSATNVTGFTALPAGDRGNNGEYGNMTLGTYFWHSGEFSSWGGQIFYIQQVPDASILPFDKEFGASVRCLKD